jgi:Cysteine-rich secretory protein family
MVVLLFGCWFAPARSDRTPVQAAVLEAPVSDHAEHDAQTVSTPEPSWLTRVNYWRAMAKLAPLAEDPSLSEGDFMHARYLLSNYATVVKANGGLGAAAHREMRGQPWSSREGARTAAMSDVSHGCGPSIPARDVTEIDRFMSGPFHRMRLLDPDAKMAGFSVYDEEPCWTAVLTVPTPSRQAEIFDQPVEFPPDKGIVSLEWSGDEWPDPLASCPGYSTPTGLPVTVQFGRGMEPGLSAHSMLEDGRPIDHCAFDTQSYSNPDSSAQRTARAILKYWGAVMLIPRRPLRPGATYTVSVTALGEEHTWSFRVEAQELVNVERAEEQPAADGKLKLYGRK